MLPNCLFALAKHDAPASTAVEPMKTRRVVPARGRCRSRSPGVVKPHQTGKNGKFGLDNETLFVILPSERVRVFVGSESPT